MCESVILCLITKMLCKVVDAYRESKTAELIGRFAEKMKMLFNESIIWYAIRKPERASGFLENSVFIRAIQSIIDWFLHILRKICKPLSLYIKNSIAWELLSALISRFEIIIGIFIFIQTVLPHPMWFNSYAVLLVILIFGLYVIKCISDKRYDIKIGELDFAFLLFILVLFLSAITSIVPMDSMRIFVINMIPFLLVLVMVNAIKDKYQIGTLLYFIIGGITIASLYGMWQYINRIPVDEALVDVSVSGSVRRAFSTMGNPNNYAEYLVLTIPFYAAAFLNTKNDLARTAIMVLSTLPILNLYMTSSRSSWIGFMVAVFVYVFLVNRKLIPVFIVLGIAMIPFLPNSILHRLGTIGRDSSSAYRVNIWRGSYKLLKEYWLTGIGLGPGPFKKLIHYYIKLDLPTHSHMVPLQIWLEAGLAGILAFIWLIARLVKKGMTDIFNKKDRYLGNVMAACIASLAGVLTIGMVEYVWFYSRVQSMFWIVVGILLICINISAGKSVEVQQDEK
jgi:putative inorganic carbon (HCO3(-)) transporter